VFFLQLGAGTMYADHAACGPVAGCRGGMAGACNESPIMASLAVQHMLMQSWNARPIAIFPSVPPSWAEARFARLRAEGAVLVSALRTNGSTVWFSLNATRGGSVAVHSTITDLEASAAAVTLTAQPPAGSGLYTIDGGAEPWSSVFYSKARGPPSSQELALTPLPAGPTNLWGSRDVNPLPRPPPPPPGPPPPVPPPRCPSSGCAGCGGCHWPYLNATEPDPTRPFAGWKANATTLQCEDACANATRPSSTERGGLGGGGGGGGGGCVGFTQRGSTCWFYEQVSGRFSHRSASVSWHPKPRWS
jgi:hypothetical protein